MLDYGNRLGDIDLRRGGNGEDVPASDLLRQSPAIRGRVRSANAFSCP